jgi:hypothetical protein
MHGLLVWHAGDVPVTQTPAAQKSSLVHGLSSMHGLPFGLFETTHSPVLPSQSAT